ncbi:hypothetical protein QZH41_009171 [Actinostola sp. cb2023]|nr:hypothetical protein QZH41_009171 [Actinostola sp. cb2023]
MVLESVNLKGHTGIRIKSERENSYVCISGSDGKLVLEPRGNNLDRCIFVEDYNQGFTMFKSVFNANWFLGSKKSGRIKQPWLTNRTQTAVLFLVETLPLS